MTSRVEIRNGVCLVHLAHEYDRANVEELRAEIERCQREAPSVALDFAAVTFIDAGVIDMIWDLVERVPPGHWIGVVRPSPWIEELFSVAGLTGSANFRLYPDLNDALADYASN